MKRSPGNAFIWAYLILKVLCCNALFSRLSLGKVALFWPRRLHLFTRDSSPKPNKRQFEGSPGNQTANKLLRNFQMKQPSVAPEGDKFCQKSLLNETFANTYGKPTRVAYSPPIECGPLGSWAAVILSLTVTSKGNQYDRLGSIFLNGVEIMRTSTAEPTAQGIIWTIEKDITKYMPLLALSNTELVMELNNILDASLGINAAYNVQLSATYYVPTAGFPAPESADSIIPLSHPNSSVFSVPNAATTAVQIPDNAISASVEIYASGAAQEEFWYSNILDQALQVINGNSTETRDNPQKGPFREVQLWIDNQLAGAAYPFPVIYTGGILLSWWRPLASYGSFDQPTYTIDITPFLPLLTDSSTHNFTLTVEGQGKNRSINSEWLLSGNIAIKRDPSGKRTTGKLLNYSTLSTIQSSGQLCSSEVYLNVEANRKLSITSSIIPGSGAPRQDTMQQASGSSISQTDSTETYSDQFSFSLGLSLKRSNKGLQGSISHSYNRALKPATYNGFATSIQTNQSAIGLLSFDGNGKVKNGVGQTGQLFVYSDEKGYTFNRDYLIANETNILKDFQSGLLANNLNATHPQLILARPGG
ncbi:hypothetical protein O181_025889, partial [Austropuccinia psidii MF-1]|nr:hypothetical protein [Austropuccinia psidii MF-1]